MGFLHTSVLLSMPPKMSPTRALRQIRPSLRTSPRLHRSFASSDVLRDQGSKIDSLPATFKRVTLVGASLGWIVAGLMYFYSPSTVHTAQGQKTREGFLRESLCLACLLCCPVWASADFVSVEDWDEKRRKEGDLSVEETAEMRKEEEAWKREHPDQPTGKVLR